MKNTVTIKDIAIKANVSTATVSRYLNQSGYVSKNFKKRIGDAVREMNFVPNQVAISLKTTETRLIGIVIPELSNVSFMDTVKAISKVVTTNGYQPLILSSDESPAEEHKILDVLIAHRIDGLIIASADTDDKKISKINQSWAPVVMFDRDLCNHDGKILVDSVVNDNFGGAQQIVTHLISLGHRRIAIEAGTKLQPHLTDRLSGYHSALEEAGILPDPAYIQKSDLTFDDGYALTKQWMQLGENCPTAIFALNNMAALGTLSALKELNVSVPEQVSVCAFGEFKYHTILQPDLTVVNQHPRAMGQEAAELLLKKMEATEQWLPKKIVLPATIIQRESCAPPPKVPVYG